MFELVKVTENAFFVQCPAKIGIVRVSNGALLIDSGNDGSAGKKVLKILESMGLSPLAIYNTHSHADHIGGNKLISERTGCAIYAPGAEQAFTRYTFLEPALLYGGCPPAELRHKFLEAQESPALPLSEAALPEGFSAVPLPGHSPDMVGYKTSDGVFFIADSLSSRETLEKYRVGYIYDVGKYLETLEKLTTESASIFIPSHADPTDDIAPLAAYNRGTVLEIAEKILELCAEPSGFDSILSRIFTDYGLTMTREQHALVGSTVRSYLSWLCGTGKAEAIIENNVLMWRRK